MSTRKLLCQMPLKKDPQDPKTQLVYDMIRKDLDLVKRPETEVVIQSPEHGLTTVAEYASNGLRFLNDRDVLQSVLDAVEREGFDGVIIACFFDPALGAAKGLLDIPVVGLAEPSMHFAASMGLKFAVITSNSGFIPGMTENIHQYGMEAQALETNPVRSIAISEQDFHGGFAGDYGPVVDSFTATAQGCIEDGAEVLIAGCGIMSPMLTLAGVTDIQGVPIIDPELIALKMAESMVDLDQAGIPYISRKGIYAHLPRNTGSRFSSKALADSQ
ncbi:MAG: aspartate/glutamate racemase family protein [Dehalococcoidia bacterium]